MTDTVTATALADLFGVSSRTIRDLATGRGGESAISSATAERGRLARAQTDLTETKVYAMRGELVAASAVEAEWGGVLRTMRAGMLAAPSRCAARLPHLSAHDAAEIDVEVRAALTEIGEEKLDRTPTGCHIDP